MDPVLLSLLACGSSTPAPSESPSREQPAGDKTDAPIKQRAKAKQRGAKARAKPEGKAVGIKGTLQFTDDGAKVTPCDGGDDILLKAGIGSPEAVRKQFGEDANNVYVELRGIRKEDGPIHVRTLELAATEGISCDTPFTHRTHVFAEDPTWSLLIDEDSQTFQRTGEDDLALTAFEKQAKDGATLRYVAQTPDGTSLTLTMQRKRCIHGTAYPVDVHGHAGRRDLGGPGRGQLPIPNRRPKPTPKADDK